MQKRKKLAAPFVITAAAFTSVGLAGACGGQSESDSGSGGAGGSTGGAGGSGGGTGATGGTTGTGATGGTTGTGATGGTTGTGATGGTGGTGACPTTPPKTYAYGGGCTTAGLICSYDVTCHSGPDKSVYECDGANWSLAPATCANPEDECSDGKHCTQGKWYPSPDPNYNPPGPCPTSAPVHGAACKPGGFGGDPSACGYPCDKDGGAGWSVAHCDFDPDGGTPAWQLDPCQ